MAVVSSDGTRRYVGATLALREHNGYHDSYFYATVYDAEADRLTDVEYNSTAFAGGGTAYLDATTETLDAVERMWERDFLSTLVAEFDAEQNAPTKGKRVVLGRDYRSKKLGRTLVEGTEGTVFWRGPNRYDDGATYRVGVAWDGTGRDEGLFHAEADLTVLGVREVTEEELLGLAARARELAHDRRSEYERALGDRYLAGRARNAEREAEVEVEPEYEGEAAMALADEPETGYHGVEVDGTLVALARHVEATEPEPTPEATPGPVVEGALLKLARSITEALGESVERSEEGL
jgi:hypothetical protein